jgi:hypothetical protein
MVILSIGLLTPFVSGACLLARHRLHLWLSKSVHDVQSLHESSWHSFYHSASQNDIEIQTWYMQNHRCNRVEDQ